MEGYFPPEDRDKWLNAIEVLSNINRLVQEDIRDMILTGNDEKYRLTSEKDKQERSRNLLVGDKNISSNKLLTTENSISETSVVNTAERKGGKRGTKAQLKKRNSSRKGTNLSKHSNHRDKDKKYQEKKV